MVPERGAKNGFSDQSLSGHPAVGPVGRSWDTGNAGNPCVRLGDRRRMRRKRYGRGRDRRARRGFVRYLRHRPCSRFPQVGGNPREPAEPNGGVW